MSLTGMTHAAGHGPQDRPGRAQQHFAEQVAHLEREAKQRLAELQHAEQRLTGLDPGADHRRRMQAEAAVRAAKLLLDANISEAHRLHEMMGRVVERKR